MCPAEDEPRELYRRDGLAVWQQGRERYLKFDGQAIQTRLDPQYPHRLIEPHFQRMALALVFNPQPRRLTLLGLGGGALVHFLCHYRPDLELSVVENNPAVAAIARDWFDLPAHGHSLQLADAYEHVHDQAVTGPCQDMLLVDIYNGDTLPEAVFSDSFLTDCRRLCTADGMLVINYLQPEQHRAEADMQRLKRIFRGGVLLVPVPQRLNLVIIAFKCRPAELRHAHLRSRAGRLQAELELPLVEWLEDVFTLYPRDERRKEPALML